MVEMEKNEPYSDYFDSFDRGIRISSWRGVYLLFYAPQTFLFLYFKNRRREDVLLSELLSKFMLSCVYSCQNLYYL